MFKLTSTISQGFDGATACENTPPCLFFPVCLNDTVTLKPNAEYFLRGSVKRTELNNNDDWIFMPYKDKMAEKYLAFTTSIVSLRDNTIPLRVINLREEPCTIYKGTTVGQVESINYYGTNRENIRLMEPQQQNSSNSSFEHLKNIEKRILENKNMTKDQQSKLCNLIRSFSDIFSINNLDIGCCKVVQHEINTETEQPIHQQIRRVPLGLEDKVDNLVTDLLSKGIIKPSESPWNAPIVVVTKKSGDIRLCIDYRKLNAITKRPIFPIPETSQLFDSLHGANYFSSLDLSNAYYQVEMSKKDREKTAFATRRGQYEFQRMPFGLSGAPSTFQRMMTLILKSENWEKCLIYLDDVLVFSRGFEQHMERLQQVFQRFREAGAKLSPSKCSFLNGQLKFLGHIITGEGITTDPEKVSAIKNWKKPSNITELRSFLGFCNYYRKFISNYSNLTCPLEALMKNSNISSNKKNILFWQPLHETAFENLKKKLSSAPVLAFPNNKDMFVLDTDASHDGMGAVLSQIQSGEERVIAYASKKLTKCQQNYCVTRKELLAVYTFVTQFRHYLLGREFRIRTDHKSLTWMLNWDKPNSSQYCSWIAELEIYNFTIEHRKGSEHINADALSRLPQCGQCEIQHDNPCKKRNTKLLQEENIRNLNMCVIKPNKARWNIIASHHNGMGHIGMEKTLEILRHNYNWQNMENDVKTYIENCIFCAQRKAKGNIVKRPDFHMTATNPFEKIIIDITGPLPPSKFGHRFILSMVDVYSRYIMAIPLRETSSETLVRAILEKWIAIFGYPDSIISDNGANFVSKVFKDFCTENGIMKIESSPYHPQSNGIVERQFRTLKDMIYATSKDKKLDWSLAIPFVEIGLRATKHKSTGYSSNEIIFGDLFKLPRNLLTTPRKDTTHTDYIEHINNHRRIVMNQMKKKHITSNKTIRNRYAIGDMVMVRSMKPQGLMKPRYVGPCRVIEVVSGSTYKVEYKGSIILRNDYHLKRFNGKNKSIISESNESILSICHKKNMEVPHDQARTMDVQLSPRKVYNNSQTENKVNRYPTRERKSTNRYA